MPVLPVDVLSHVPSLSAFEYVIALETHKTLGYTASAMQTKNNYKTAGLGIFLGLIFLVLFMLLTPLSHVLLTTVFRHAAIKRELTKERVNLETQTYDHMWFPVIVQLSTNKNEQQSELLILRLDAVGGFSSIVRNQLTFNKTNQTITIDDIKPYLENIKYDAAALSFLIPVQNQGEIKRQLSEDRPLTTIDLSVTEQKDGTQSIDLRLEGSRIEHGWYVATENKIIPKYYLHSTPIYHLYSSYLSFFLGLLLSSAACRLIYKKIIIE
jgi:hypothetical protein